MMAVKVSVLKCRMSVREAMDKTVAKSVCGFVNSEGIGATVTTSRRGCKILRHVPLWFKSFYPTSSYHFLWQVFAMEVVVWPT